MSMVKLTLILNKEKEKLVKNPECIREIVMWILVMRPWTYYLISITFFICKMTILVPKIQYVYSMWYLAQSNTVFIFTCIAYPSASTLLL